MKKFTTALVVLINCYIIDNASAAQNMSYVYDSKGSLIYSENQGNSGGNQKAYSYDQAENRNVITVVDTSGASLLVYRFYQGPSHFYTNYYPEGANVGFKFEGYGFLVYKLSASGMHPLYRCYNASNQVRLISVQQNCEGLSNEGAFGYAADNSSSGLVPLYRFHNSSATDFLTTETYDEGVNAGYVYEGILGYVPQ
ncbi:hypothetical protein [Novosphingobium sp. AAP1]|uniref:hypothetical protein n=1 Tax=Novosphingobium sp. AAP1 TaxID=1523413 RepID=UPI000ADEA030|nr:hypothetical protein [Novosphingobium sp. AAP1]